MDKAVILARGLGTRMRRNDGTAKLDEHQAAAAESGIKAMIPIGRPFLDYVISALADAGYRSACLVIGPEPEFDAVRNHYSSMELRRVRIVFAVQQKPLGTADAVAAADTFAGGDPFLVINSDNYYPREALGALREISTPGIAAFERDSMIAGSNIPPERISGFAVIESTGDGYLRRIIEKPSPEKLQKRSGPQYVSMNCWRFNPSIFEACRAIKPSPRGELELPAAVQYAIKTLGERFRVLPMSLPVLDLTGRGDISPVASRLSGVEVTL